MLFFKRKKPTTSIVHPDYEKLSRLLAHCDLIKKIEIDISPSSPLYAVVENLNHVISERQASASSTLSDVDNTVQNSPI